MMEQHLREALRDTMAASGPPPPMSSATTLAAGRRARVRRHGAWIGAGTAVAGITVAVAVLASGTGPALLSPGGPADQSAGATAPISGPAPQKSSEDGPPWPNGPDGSPQGDRTARAGTRYDQGVKLLDALLAAVPAGYTVPAASGSQDEQPARGQQAQFETRNNGVEVWSYMSQVAITSGPGTGTLLVEVHTAANTLPTEPCQLAKQFWSMGGTCTTQTVGSITVGVATATPRDDRLDQWAAVRYPDGVVVFVAQGKTFSENKTPLTKLPMSAAELAAFATHERFHLQ